jgi:hypothetical protein
MLIFAGDFRLLRASVIPPTQLNPGGIITHSYDIKAFIVLSQKNSIKHSKIPPLTGKILTGRENFSHCNQIDRSVILESAPANEKKYGIKKNTHCR